MMQSPWWTVSAFGIAFQPLVLPVMFSRFLRRVVATRYRTLRAAWSFGKCPDVGPLFGCRAFNDAFALSYTRSCRARPGT